MDAKEIAWQLFCRKGTVADYLFYSRLAQESEEKSNAADQDDRIGHPTHQCRRI